MSSLASIMEAAAPYPSALSMPETFHYSASSDPATKLLRRCIQRSLACHHSLSLFLSSRLEPTTSIMENELLSEQR